MSSLIVPVGSLATVSPSPTATVQDRTMSSDWDNNLVILKNDCEEAIYEYQIPSDAPSDGVPDDDSLAARDSLALGCPEKTSLAGGRFGGDGKRVRRRQALLFVACCLLLGIIVLTTVLTTTNNSSSGEQDVTESIDQPEVDKTVEDPTSLSKSVLGSIVSNSSALDDPTSPEGRAFNIVSSEDLDNPNDIATRYSLLTAYFATNGDGWANNNGWATHSADHCSWHGNVCESPGVITETVLDNNNLKGNLPSDVCLLTSMKSLILSANTLDGSFPSCISNMEYLEELHVNGNSFKGPLPSGLHALPNLARVTLSYNEFTGTLSTLFDKVQLGDPVFPSLMTLNLDDNKLSGTVPDENLAQVTALMAMTFHNNPQLSGSLSQTCQATRTMLASADCNLVVCPCCNDGNDCL